MSQSDEQGRGLNAAAFASLLKRLGPDAEHAGAAYEALRRALVGFLAWRGAATPEECADETLDRLAARLREGTPVDDVPRFARGIARLVLLEHWRRPDARRGALEDVRPGPRAEEPDDDNLHECLDRCLAELAPDGRELILSYYVAEGRSRIDNRRRLATTLGVSESALRNRAQRLRDRLELCMARCLSLRAAGNVRRDADDTKA
jgi:DNA-directed RNA polymerase specialized sigma24 family protein